MQMHLRSFGPMRTNALGRRMEIIGASTMNGFGDLGSNSGCQPLYQACPTILQP